jgi:peptidoglycan/LPS O-acetylase OafA/YrhL
MPNSRSQARRRWISKKRSLRRRWPVYVMMLLFCATAAAILVLVFIETPARPARAQQRAPVPSAIR